MRSPSWRFSTLCVEALYNVFTRGSRLRLLALLLVMVGGASSLLSTFDWHQLERETSALQATGWTTYVVSDSEGAAASVTARSCSDLSGVAGVTSVAALSERTLKNFTQLGARSVPVVVVGLSAGQHDFADLAPNGDDIPVMVGHELEASIGTVRRFTDRNGNTTYRSVRLIPRELDLVGLSGSIVVPIPLNQMNGLVQECVVTVAPSSPDTVGIRLRSAVSADSLQVESRRLGPAVAIHPYLRFLHRSERTLFPVLGVFLGVVAGLLFRSRASEIGVYRISGTSRRALLVLFGLENLLLTGCWALSSLASSIAMGQLSALPVAASWEQAWLPISTFSFVSAIFAIFSSGRDVSALLKDR